MRFFLGLALRVLNRNDTQGQRIIMKEMLVYQQLNPSFRSQYKAPLAIKRNKRRLFALAFLRVVLDKPQLIASFLLINLVFFCLMLARVMIHWEF